uniref:Aminotransferase-like plant mobile domain-containing protein n=1 Tax=Fagus sylvatica TaxID=28930 RepID=A0A2N9EU73_FAGSY
MEVNKSLSDQCKKQLRTTPFGWLLNLHCNIEASGRMLEVMLATWNADERAFQVGDKLIPFTLYDVALILGLPVTRESIDCNKSPSRGCLVKALLVTHFKTTWPERTKLVTLLTKPSIKVLDKIWAYEHLGIGEKHAQINQPFPRFLAWSHQRMFSQKAMAAFNNSDNVLCVLAAMPWEQQESVVQEAMETLKETYGSSYTAISRHDGAVKRGKPAKKKAKAAMVDLASSPSKRDKRGRPANNEEEVAAAMVDLASSLSKLAKRVRSSKNEGETTMMDLASSLSKGAIVDLVSSPSKGATFVRYTRGKTRAQRNVMIVPPESKPVRNEPTAHDEAVLADLRKKWSFAIMRATRRSGVDSNEIAISTKTYEIMGRDVSSLLGDQAWEESSRWISTALGQLQHKETKDQKRVNNPLRMTSLDQNLCSAVVGYAQCQKNASG